MGKALASMALAATLSLGSIPFTASQAHAEDDLSASHTTNAPVSLSDLEQTSIGEFIRFLGESAAQTVRMHAEAVRDGSVDALLAVAREHEGDPYAYGGTTPRGFDCSGFVKYCFQQALGIELPRTAGAQSSQGESVPFDELQRGDLLFWGSKSGVYHVGIYLEDGNYIHAAGRGKGVRVESMDYFMPTFAKRLV